MLKPLLIAAILATGLGASVPPVQAAVVIVRVAPPPLRVEQVPGPRQGYVWVDGHWDWRSNRHTWVRGTWVRERHGYVYNQPQWIERDGRWHMARGNWRRGNRDNDGDGVRNRDDARPNNPNRN